MTWERGRNLHPQDDIARLVGAVLGIQIDAWPPDRADVERPAIPGRAGRRAGVIKADGEHALDQDHLVVLEVDTTTAPEVSLARWSRWVEQGRRAVVLIQAFDGLAPGSTKVVRGAWLGARAAAIVGDRLAYFPLVVRANHALPTDDEVTAQLARVPAAIEALGLLSRSDVEV